MVPSEYCQSLVSWWRNARGDVEEGGECIPFSIFACDSVGLGLFMSLT